MAESVLIHTEPVSSRDANAFARSMSAVKIGWQHRWSSKALRSCQLVDIMVPVIRALHLPA
jgi:hypothetical protein